MTLRAALVAVVALLIAPRVAQTFAQAPATQPLDAYIEQALKAFDVPGMAVAVVKDQHVVYSKGFGLRKAGRPERVDVGTLFQVGSTTKAMTTAALATLVDDGKLKWDGPVRDYLPTFQMYDPYVSREMTVRDLLSHRSGLGMGEGDLLLFPPSNLSRGELVSRMKYLKPLWSFRTHWAYCNLCFVAAGELIPVLTGKSWEEYIQARIFGPLGMRDSRVSSKGLDAVADVAAPHELIDGAVTPVPWDVIDNAAAAGAVVSNVSDMSKWIAVQLNHGAMPNGERLFSEASGREMWQGVSIRPMTLPAGVPDATRRRFSEYALGWFVWDYRGHQVIEHSGGVTGMITEVVLVPERNFGFVIFSNTPAANAGVVPAVMYRLLDDYMGVTPENWIDTFKAIQQKALEGDRQALARSAGAREAGGKPSLPLERYAGTYRDDWLGEAEVRMEGGRLVFSVSWSPHLTGDIEHWQHDTFVVKFRDRTVPDAYIYFSLRPDSTIDRARMAAVSALADFSFDFQDLELRPARR
jgi:CubicO group peptidase (beta-lactamase class C family)